MLSAEEQSKYDRQLRLWGVRAQTYLKQSKVLVCGLTGVHVEVVKNLVRPRHGRSYGVYSTVTPLRLLWFHA